MESAFTLAKIGDFDVALWLHTANDPLSDEWTAACDAMEQLQRTNGFALFRSLIISDGGAPNVAQRTRFSSMFARPTKGSLITTVLDNRVKRALAKVITWMNPEFRAYEPAKAEAALLHVDLSHERAALGREYAALQSRLPTIRSLQMVASVLGWQI